MAVYHKTHLEVLDVHLSCPETAELIQVLARLGVLDMAANCVVGAAHPSLDLEVDACLQTSLGTANNGMVTKLVLHLSKEDTSSVHVWLCDEIPLVVVEEPHDGDALHETAHGVAEELATRLEGAINADLVLGSHEKIAGLGRVV